MNKFNTKPSKREVTDFSYAVAKGVITPLAELPRKFLVDYRLIDNQGKVGKCIGEAFQADAEADMLCKGEAIKLSSRFHYEECKRIDGINGEGSTAKVGAQVMKNKGICTESLYPFDPMNMELAEHMQNLEFDTPSDLAYEDAKSRKIDAYAIMPDYGKRDINVDELLSAIYNENGAIACVTCTQSFMQDQKGVIGRPMGLIFGGHAIYLCGYDLDKEVEYDYSMIYPQGSKTKYKGVLIFKNSWTDTNEAWGDNGLGYIPLDLVNYRNADGMIKLFSDVVITMRGKNDGSYDKDYHKKYNEERVNMTEIILKIDDNKARVNGEDVVLDCPPTIIEDRTLVPLRFIGEAFGCHVQWDDETRTITMRRG